MYLKVEGKEKAYIYMGDRWNSKDVGSLIMCGCPLVCAQAILS